MAKKIKFPLEMKDGVMVRTIEELRVNFDAEKFMGHFLSRKLHTWLQDRCYEAELNDVKDINPTDKNAVLKLCKVFSIEAGSIEIGVAVEDIVKRQVKLRRLRQVLDDKEIFDNLDSVAMDQNELETILKKGIDNIYLFEGSFEIKNTVGNVSFTGIKEPKVSVAGSAVFDFEAGNIAFEKVVIDQKIQGLLNQLEYDRKNLNDKKKKQYEASGILDFRLSSENRLYCEKLYLLLQDELFTVEHNNDLNSKNLVEILEKEEISTWFPLDNFGKGQRECLKAAQIDGEYYNFMDRIRGNF